jgi:hypothetical protein
VHDEERTRIDTEVTQKGYTMPKSYYTSTTGTRSSGNTRSSGHSHRSRDWGKYWDEDHIRTVEVSLVFLPSISPFSLPSALSGSLDAFSCCIASTSRI